MTSPPPISRQEQHKRLALARRIAAKLGFRGDVEYRHDLGSEEILASLIGSLIVEGDQDRQSLFYKALFEAVARGMGLSRAIDLLEHLRGILEKML